MSVQDFSAFVTIFSLHKRREHKGLQSVWASFICYPTSAQPLPQVAPLLVVTLIPICFMHSRPALYWRHMVTFTLITNIRPGIFGVAICISCRADFQTSWSEVWLSCSYSVCGSVCLALCLDVNVEKAKHLLSVSVSGQSCLNKGHFPSSPTPPTGEGNHCRGL